MIEAPLAALRTLERYGRECSFTGSDQYDGLNATRIPDLLRNSVVGRRVVIQAVKRSPVDLRPLLGVPPGQNAASLAWAASAYARNGFLDEEQADVELRRTIAALERLRLSRYAEPCWGYHFDFQSRVFFYPRTAPNVIATVYGGMALCDAHERLGDPELLEQAHAVGRFVMRHIPQSSDPPGAFFGYLVGDRSPIHNSNMLVCALLSRLSALTRDSALAGRAREGVHWTVTRQRKNGSWPYGERPGLSWVDNFHTGYMLDALDTCLRAGTLDDPTPLERGLAFYRSRMFLSDGTPRYYEHQTYPIDMWSVAQSIQTLSRAAGRDPTLADLAVRVFQFAHARMRRPDGLYCFQRRRLWRNPSPHMRGAVAPMMLALTYLLRILRAEPAYGVWPGSRPTTPGAVPVA